MYRAKYTLTQLIQSGVMAELLGITKQVKNGKKTGIKENNLNFFNVMSIIADLSLQAVMKYDFRAKSAVNGNTHIEINVNADIEECYNAVLSTLQANRLLIQSYATHQDELVSALNSQIKFDIKNKDKGQLYLRINNLEEIRNMSPRQKKHLLDDIVDNVYFNSDFAKTQASLGLRGKNNRDMFFTSLSSNERKGYSTLRKEWERKVGYK